MADNVTSIRKNRHPVDRFGEIKTLIEDLEREKEDLRTWILANPDKRDGQEFRATIASPMRRHYDMAAIKKYFGLKALEQFCVKSKATMVYVTRKK